MSTQAPVRLVRRKPATKGAREWNSKLYTPSAPRERTLYGRTHIAADGPGVIGSSQPKPTSGVCIRCKRELPPERRHAAAHLECVTVVRLVPTSGT